jgi:hypothetical protein
MALLDSHIYSKFLEETQIPLFEQIYNIESQTLRGSPEPWQDLIDNIESDLDNYVRFDRMESYEAFQVMEDFAHTLSDALFKGQLLDALSRPKPFQNFKYLIDRSAYRQDWFAFKSNAYREHVERQIEAIEE